MIAHSNRIKRICGYVFIAAIWVLFLGTLAIFGFAFAVYATLHSPGRGREATSSPAVTVAATLYGMTFMPIWQRAPRVQFDPELIYVPAPGRFRFHGPDFDTWVTMTKDGLRQQSALTAETQGRDLVVIAGDSFAMGWGVGDDETFSAVLQQRYHYGTVNTGVSSYGTVRELLRLRRLGLLDRASVLVIQFCANDAEENRAFLHGWRPDTQHARLAWQDLQQGEDPEPTYLRVLGGTAGYLRAQAEAKWKRCFSPPKREVRDPRFRQPDSAPLIATEFLAVIDQFPEIKGKPLLVIELNGCREPAVCVDDLKKIITDRPNLGNNILVSVLP